MCQAILCGGTTLVEKTTWKVSTLHRCVQARFLTEHGKFRKLGSKIFTKHPCNMQKIQKFSRSSQNFTEYVKEFCKNIQKFYKVFPEIHKKVPKGNLNFHNTVTRSSKQTNIESM